MVKASNDVSSFVCANTIQENEKRLVKARIEIQVLRHKEKGRTKRDLSRLFHKLNQVKVKEDSIKSAEKSGLPCHNRNITSCWYGPVSGFPSGSWWGIRMDCSRDRVHDPFDADVDEGPFGVASICTSHDNMNEDVDLGDFLTLTGQVYHEEQANMDPFILNYKSQIPLRLIRSYNLQDNIAPNTGYRYDGLYIVISHWIGVDADGTKYNKFALMRYADQEPSCWNSRTSETLPSMEHCNPSASLIYIKPCVSSNVYDLRKCSHNTDSISRKRKFSHRDSSDNQPVMKLIPPISIRKSIPESSILTRHVFKKPKSTESTLRSASILDQKTLTGLGTSTSKTHSTNISIRMGLYESSHNVQEVKKSVSTMLHKPFKPIDISNRATLDIGGVCLPPKEENKPIARIDVDKMQTNTQPIETASYNEHVVTNNVTLNKRGKKSCSLDMHPSKCSYVVPSSLKSPENSESTMESKEQLRDGQRSTNISVQKLDFDKEPQRNSVATHVRILKRQDDTSEVSGESLCMQGTKFFKSLDSLTPDKILNLINKEKHHPLSKLLIENVIGLTNEECATWNTSKMTTSDASPKTNYKRDNIKENVACLSEDTLNRRYCRYSKSKILPWKVTKQTDMGKFDKVLSRQSRGNAENCNGNTRMKDQSGISKESTEFLSPFHVQTSLQATAQHTRSAYDIKTRMRTNKGVVLAKQEFSGSSIKKNRYKKRDREIANLSIDANIGPKTRGPRNRRLRCINNTYTNKRYYSTFNTVMYPTGKRNRITEKQRYKTSFKRKSKLTKVSRQHARDRQANKDRYRVSNTLHTKSDGKDIESSVRKKKHFDSATKSSNNDDSNYNNNEINGERENKTDATDHNVTKASFDRSLQKKLAQTVPLSCRAPQTSRLHYFHKREVEKPRTMDATTQCRLLFEEPVESIPERTIENDDMQSTLFERSANQRAIVKMNWDKSGKVKSESIRNDTCNDQNAQINETSQFSPISTLMDVEHYTGNLRCSCKKSTEKSLKDKTSAFVPVNAVDSDVRIARLRSIGFKPIIKPRSSPLVANERTASSDRKVALMSTSKVMKRNVAEEYEKYTNNEDNNMVVYMDDKLQYEDIEQEEDDESAFGRGRIKSRTKTLMRPTVRNIQLNDDTVLPKALASCDNIESPWHGWKKIETDNRSYWIGW